MTPLETELRQTLEDQVAPEFLDMLADGLDALAVMQYTDHELPVMNALNRPEEYMIIEETHDLIKDALVQVCLLHRITPDSVNCDIAGLSKFVRALLLAQYWDDKETILTVCESDAPDEDKLASLIAIVGELTENEAADIINDVDPNFMRGLAKLYSGDGIAIQEEQFVIPKPQLEKLRSWRDLMKAEKCMGYRMVKAGYMPGYAFAEYMKRASNAINQGEDKAIAFEVIPFLLLGRDTWDNPLRGWRDNSALLGLEPNEITGVDVFVLKLLGEYDLLFSKKA